MFADSLLRITQDQWTRERAFQYSVKDSSPNETRTVRWRFVFSYPAKDENRKLKLTWYTINKKKLQRTTQCKSK